MVESDDGLKIEQILGTGGTMEGGAQLEGGGMHLQSISWSLSLPVTSQLPGCHEMNDSDTLCPLWYDIPPLPGA